MSTKHEADPLDYVTGWHAKALDLFAHRTGEFAFVTTNSITQGDQVPRLFGPLQAAGWHIKFAHRTFAWTSEAPGRAAVHCVIVGFTRTLSAPRLWDYVTPKAQPQTIGVSRLNAYLVDGPAVLVEQQRKPLSPLIAKAAYGNMARDDGALLVEPGDHATVMADPVAAKYVRPFIGARQLVHNEPRWCLWLTELDPADINRSPILKSRLQHVAEFRAKSSAASTRDMAATPHLFGQRSQPETAYLCVPRHVSESRRYFPAQRYEADVIAGDANFTIPDPDGLQFAIISASMFITWQAAVGGRLKSDLRFANTLTWNTFPLPEMDEPTKAALIKAGEGILAARALHPERTLADAYNPLAMDPVLIKAHDKLDGIMDRVFGSPKRLTTERQRLELLFASYAQLTTRDGGSEGA